MPGDDEEAAISIKSFGLGDDAVICATCYAVRGLMNYRPPGARQLCDCEIGELKARGEEVPTYGDDLHGTAELCRCCGIVLVHCGSKWAKWFCRECLGRVKDLNESAGRCVVPIGPHSIMNGVFLRANRAHAPEAFDAFADQLLTFFRESGGIEAWSRAVTRRNLTLLGLDTQGPIPLSTYLVAAQGSKVLTKEAAIRRLEASRGLRTGA
jgi:hypothetical protein